MTWNDVAVRLPEFVQWAVQAEGPLPDGEVRRELPGPREGVNSSESR